MGRSTSCLVLLLLFTLSTRGQECTTWTGVGNELCIQVGYEPGMSVYIPPNDTATRLFTQLSFTLDAVVLTPHTPGLGPCYQASLVLACGMTLRPCQVLGDSVVPVQPCYEMFQYINETCFPSLAAAGFEAFLGTGGYYPQEFRSYGPPVNPWILDVVHVNGSRYLVPFLPDLNHRLPGWENGSTPYDQEKGNSTLELRTDLVTCQANGVGVTSYTAICGEGLVQREDDPLACVLTCPGPPITEEEYRDANTAFVAVASVSFMACCASLLLYLLVPNTRRFPMLHGLFLCSAGALTALGLLLAAPDYERIWCGGEDVPLDAEQQYFLTPTGYGVTLDLQNLYLHGLGCKFQASFLYIGMFWGILQWMFLSLENVLLSFNLDQKIKDRGWDALIVIRHLGYQLISITIPVVWAIVLFNVDRFGYTYSTAYCFVTQEDNQSWILTFWIIPISLCIIIGVLCLIITIVRVTWFLFRRGFTRENALFLWSLMWWPTLFVLSMVAIYVFAMAYYIDRAVKKDEFESDLAEYLTCALLSVSGDSLDSCPYDSSSFSYPTMVVQGLNFGLMGLVLATILLLNRNVWSHLLGIRKLYFESASASHTTEAHFRGRFERLRYHFFPYERARRSKIDLSSGNTVEPSSSEDSQEIPSESEQEL